MIYKNIKVEIPSGCVVYPNSLVYYSKTKKYDPIKKYNVYSRVCVGKTIDEKSMNPNDNYESYFQNEEVKREAPLLSDTVSVGLNAVIDKLTQNLQISYILSDYYSEDECNLIKDLISYMISYETSVIQHFPLVSRRVNIYSDTIRSDSYISNFFKEVITDKKIESFLDDFNNLEKNREDLLYISYDSTNMNTSSEGIELAEYGHAKDDEGLPQVNLSLAVNQNESLPLFYELYPGSIIDNSQLIHMVNRLKSYGYKNIGLILDRGYFSKNNIDYLKDNGYDYLLMVKTNNETIRKLIDKYKFKIESHANYIDDYGVYGVSEEVKLYSKDKKKVYVHLYYDSEISACDKKSLSKSINDMSKELNEHVNNHTNIDSLDRFNKLFTLSSDVQGHLISYKCNEKAIEEAEKELGFFTIITSDEMSAAKALDIYRSRDTVEKLFRSLKSDLDYTKYRIHSSSSLKGKTFIVFLASIIRSQIFNYTKELRKQNKKDYTVNAIVRELSNIEVTKNAKDIYVRRYSLTAKQKNILNKFKLNEKDIDHMTNILNNKLS